MLMYADAIRGHSQDIAAGKAAGAVTCLKELGVDALIGPQ
jgi:hypothetical protein